MSTHKPKYKIIRGDDEKEFDNERSFEDMKSLLDDQGVDYETEVLGDETTTDGGTVEDPDDGELGVEVVDHADDGESDDQNDEDPEDVREEIEAQDVSGGTDAEVVEPEPAADDLPDERPSVDQDPVEWLPEHFVDTIQGVPTVNRKGYAVIASQYDVEVTAEPVTRPPETDFEYSEFRAIARTADGQEYSGYGSAHVKRGDDEMLLGEMAETRALKRAVSWATGIGMTAIEELSGGEEDE